MCVDFSRISPPTQIIQMNVQNIQVGGASQEKKTWGSLVFGRKYLVWKVQEKAEMKRSKQSFDNNFDN